MRNLVSTALVLMAVAAGAAQAGERIVLEKNHTKRVNLKAPAGSVIVGNPAVADVSVVDSRTLYIVGKGFGRGAVSVTDRAGRTLWDGDISVGTPTEGGVTVYKGVKASTVICANICYEQNEGLVSSSAPAP